MDKFRGLFSILFISIFVFGVLILFIIKAIVSIKNGDAFITGSSYSPWAVLVLFSFLLIILLYVLIRGYKNLK